MKSNSTINLNIPNVTVFVGDTIKWNKQLLKITHVRENSVIAEFLEYPNELNHDFPFHNTVINHRNYEVLRLPQLKQWDS